MKKIPNFCYYCGIIGHKIKKWESSFTNKSNGLPVDAIQERRGFGKKMREKSSPRSSQKQGWPQGGFLPHQIYNQAKQEKETTPTTHKSMEKPTKVGGPKSN